MRLWNSRFFCLASAALAICLVISFPARAQYGGNKGTDDPIFSNPQSDGLVQLLIGSAESEGARRLLNSPRVPISLTKEVEKKEAALEEAKGALAGAKEVMSEPEIVERINHLQDLKRRALEGEEPQVIRSYTKQMDDLRKQLSSAVSASNKADGIREAKASLKQAETDLSTAG